MLKFECNAHLPNINVQRVDRQCSKLEINGDSCVRIHGRILVINFEHLCPIFEHSFRMAVLGPPF